LLFQPFRHYKSHAISKKRALQVYMNGTGGGPSKSPAELNIVDCTELEKRHLDITNANLLEEGIAEAKRFGAGQLQTPLAQPIQYPGTIEFLSYAKYPFKKKKNAIV
jgi:hypothetical protein